MLVSSQTYASVIDASGINPVVLPPIAIGSGSTNTYGLNVYSAVVQTDRLAVVYNDAYGQPWTYDVGVSSGSIILGRTQMIFRGG